MGMNQTAKSQALLHALEKAYLLLLRMPHDSLRVNNQDVLAGARDAIAEYVGLSSERIQNEFESKAYNKRGE